MKFKTVIILLILFLCLCVGSIFVIKQRGFGHRKKSVGIHLFSNLPVNKIWEIDIKGADVHVSLIKKDGIWRVKEHFGYMADFSQISDLIDKLKDINTGQSFRADRDILRRLVLMDPDDPKAKDDEKGRALILKDRSGSIIKNIIFGKAMKSQQEEGFPVGQYIRFAESNIVYLIDQYFTVLVQGPREWLKYDIVDVKPDEIKQVMGYENGILVYKISKEHGEFKVKKEPKQKRVDDVLKKIKDGLNYLRMEDVLNPSKKPASVGIYNKYYIEYILDNGMIYKIYPSKTCSKESCYMKISIIYNGKNKELLVKAKKMNKLFSPWIYKISKWRHESFFLP